MTDKLVNLFAYLQILAEVHKAGHFCNEEIKKVIREIEVELKL